MKLNWGTGIAIFYGCFMVAMISMVVKSCNNKSDLVQEDYYQKDLGYENFRIKRANGNAMSEQIKIKYNPNTYTLYLNLPRTMENLNGDIKLYRPSNKFLDKNYKLKLDSMNSMKLELGDQFQRGLWKVKLDWESNAVPYYNELDFTI